MAAALTKTILFATARHDKKVYTHPVAVFGNVKDAKAFATVLRLAHRANDVEAAGALDPETTLTADGLLVEDTKWSVMTVRYAPSPEFAEEGDAAEDITPT